MPKLRSPELRALDLLEDLGAALWERTRHRLDLLVEDRIVVELKAVRQLERVYFSAVRSYLKAMDLDNGLILNFARPVLEVKRVMRELVSPWGLSLSETPKR